MNDTTSVQAKYFITISNVNNKGIVKRGYDFCSSIIKMGQAIYLMAIVIVISMIKNVAINVKNSSHL